MKKSIVFTVLLGLVIAAGAAADGFIIPVRPPGVIRVPPLSIKYHHVDIDITDQVSRTRIDQVFLNEFNRRECKCPKDYGVPLNQKTEAICLKIKDF